MTIPDGPMNSEHMKAFLGQGYLLLSSSKIFALVEVQRHGEYLTAIESYHQSMRRFFARAQGEKNLVRAAATVDPATMTYPAGYWPKNVYQDRAESKQFPLEYYHSRDFYNAGADNLFEPYGGLTGATTPIVTALPNQEGYVIAKIIDTVLIKPLKELIQESLGISFPEHTLQIQMTHYAESSTLALHRDKGLFQGIIGPAAGLRISTSLEQEPTEVPLNSGDVIFYAGFAFQNALKVHNLRAPEPLWHGVQAQAGRMSILVNSFPRRGTG